MSVIEKTEGIILRKSDYGDSSSIITIYTRDFGKVSAILKGAKSSKSKYGASGDLLNRVEIVLYKKEGRQVQTISQIDLVKHYQYIKDDLEGLKYAGAILELVSVLTLEEENSARLYDGLAKILDLIESPQSNKKYMFAKFYLFFIAELGYKIATDQCIICSKTLLNGSKLFFNLDNGFMCSECGQDHLYHEEFTPELFEKLLCLSTSKKLVDINSQELDKIISFLERYISFHVDSFTGLKTLKVL
jgi:DNA repair protein RecO (recombination protein O)